MRRLLLIVALAAPLLLAPSAGAAERQRCFPETGQCISGAILTYWERGGGLPVFGYPISPLRDEQSEPVSGSWFGPTQWFERDRLEDHRAEGKGVLAGRLGAAQLNALVVGLIVPAPEPVASAAAGCRFFPITGHSLCPPFRQYWERSGGLERFGYPLSEPMQFTSGAWSGTTQFFERRRMELHGGQVMLGLLGREVHDGEPGAVCPTPTVSELQRWLKTIPFRAQMGCPTGPERAADAAEQYFERGVMVYVAPAPGEARGSIAVVSTLLPITYAVYEDAWAPGQPEPTDAPPAGKLTPQRGFGALWASRPELRRALGWAVQPERADRAIVQTFSSGRLIWLTGTDYVYALGPGRIAEAKPRSWGG